MCGCDGGTCACGCILAAPVSLAAGTTVSASAQTISGAAGQLVVVLSGGDQVLASDIKTTAWQALARLSMLPGVRLGVAIPDAKSMTGAIAGLPPDPSAIKNGVHEIRALPPTHVVSLCVSEQAGLPAALDALSRLTGYAFDVSGSPAATFSVQAKGTVEEILAQLSSAAGVTITVVH